MCILSLTLLLTCWSVDDKLCGCISCPLHRNKKALEEWRDHTRRFVQKKEHEARVHGPFQGDIYFPVVCLYLTENIHLVLTLSNCHFLVSSGCSNAVWHWQKCCWRRKEYGKLCWGFSRAHTKKETLETCKKDFPTVLSAVDYGSLHCAALVPRTEYQTRKLDFRSMFRGFRKPKFEQFLGQDIGPHAYSTLVSVLPLLKLFYRYCMRRKNANKMFT